MNSLVIEARAIVTDVDKIDGELVLCVADASGGSFLRLKWAGSESFPKTGDTLIVRAFRND